MKRGIADVTTAKKRLELEESSIQQQLAKLDDQARQALAGRPRGSRARGAVAQGRRSRGSSTALHTQEQQLADQEQKLIAGEQALQTKIEAFRSQKEVIKAQYSAAEAQVKIGEAATGIGEHMADVGLAIQRAQDKTQQMQARASAIDELTTAGALEDFTSQGDDLDRQLAPGLAGKPGRRRAREDEGRARPGRPDRPRWGRDSDRPGDGRGAVASRRLRCAERLEELDAETERAVEAGDQEALHAALEALAALVRSGEKLPDEHLGSLRRDRAARRPHARGGETHRPRRPDPRPALISA